MPRRVFLFALCAFRPVSAQVQPLLCCLLCVSALLFSRSACTFRHFCSSAVPSASLRRCLSPRRAICLRVFFFLVLQKVWRPVLFAVFPSSRVPAASFCLVFGLVRSPSVSVWRALPLEPSASWCFVIAPSILVSFPFLFLSLFLGPVAVKKRRGVWPPLPLRLRHAPLLFWRRCVPCPLQRCLGPRASCTFHSPSAPHLLLMALASCFSILPIRAAKRALCPCLCRCDLFGVSARRFSVWPPLPAAELPSALIFFLALLCGAASFCDHRAVHARCLHPFVVLFQRRDALRYMSLPLVCYALAGVQSVREFVAAASCFRFSHSPFCPLCTPHSPRFVGPTVSSASANSLQLRGGPSRQISLFIRFLPAVASTTNLASLCHRLAFHAKNAAIFSPFMLHPFCSPKPHPDPAPPALLPFVLDAFFHPVSLCQCLGSKRFSGYFPVAFLSSDNLCLPIAPFVSRKAANRFVLPRCISTDASAPYSVPAPHRSLSPRLSPRPRPPCVSDIASLKSSTSIRLSFCCLCRCGSPSSC
ncbi:hypothetical protein TRVL_01838 [Trypanosoma vivax]|nr:hypothetical protein TRVL_01838 [Trypanosoma vivax]